ncbi:MAG: 6-bladed beta-propeller [Calditrichaeota bacterium]|nr:6-bladed beta-propeller [Calditrichota bacterium]
MKIITKKLIVLLFLLNCSTENNNRITLPSVIQPIALKKIDEIILDESRYRIGRIGYGHYVDKNYLYLIDRANYNCLQYSMTGAFTRIIGKRGKGPGEYTEPLSIFADNDKKEILIFDAAKFAIIAYTFDNHYLFEKTFSNGYPFPGEIQKINSHYIIAYLNYEGNNRWKHIHYFHFLDEKLNPTHSVRIDFPELYEKFNLINLATLQWYYHFKSQKIYLVYLALPEIHIYNHNNLTAIWKLNLPGFKQINRQVNSSNLFIKRKIFSRYTYVNALFEVMPDYLMVTYYKQNLPPIGKFKLFETRKYRTYYYVILDLKNKKQIVPQRSQLPGYIIGSQNGKIFILENDEPDNRKIGVYEVQLPL